MGLFAWSESKIKKLNVWDFSILKIYLFCVGLVVGAYISAFVKQYVWFFVAVIVLAFIELMYKVFKK